VGRPTRLSRLHDDCMRLHDMPEVLNDMLSLAGVLIIVFLSMVVGILVYEVRTPRSSSKPVEPMPPETDGKD
jgi:hypothetical protein